jgi:hypothetical protein
MVCIVGSTVPVWIRVMVDPATWASAANPRTDRPEDPLALLISLPICMP